MEPDDTPPSDGEILSTLCQCFDAQPSEVIDWIVGFDANAAYVEYMQGRGVCTKT
jgi:hypothetical protein